LERGSVVPFDVREEVVHAFQENPVEVAGATAGEEATFESLQKPLEDLLVLVERLLG
jgi:hypothetical protein